ncbi:MAG: hypothetical protein LC791_03900 [Acidobacteria bacterium]|nr:hypothetical protein [Acidobacteriota bacterium]
MLRTISTVFLALIVASPALADVTIKQTTSGKGLGLSGTMNGTTFIKGMKMRTDTVTGDTIRTTVFDLEAQKMYAFDSKKKEADVWDMQAFGEELSKSVDASQMKASLTENGKSKEIAGKTASGYDMEVTVPAAIGGNKEMTMNVVLTGPVWIVKGAPGTEDYAGFYKAALERGWIFSDPRAAKASPGQAKTMAEMYRKFAETGGVAYETEMQIKLSGGGPMAALMSRMGGMSSTSTVQSVETGTLADDLFAPPAGYKLKPQK